MTKAKSAAALLELGLRVLEDSTHIFEDHDNEADARELLAFCLDIDPEDLDEDSIPRAREREKYLSLIARRAGGEPFPFLTGRIEFYGLDLKVRPGPFVPRPSSELMVERAARRLRRKHMPVAVDICTGAGPIAIALADEFPGAEVWGTDIDQDGLKLGRENARRLGLSNLTFRAGDMYGGLPARLKESVDVVSGHVPYVPPDEIDDLPTEVREYEPVHTLSDQSGDGLGLMRKAVGEASLWLKPGGWLLLEVSDDLPPKIRRLVRQAGLEDMGVASDDDDLSVVIEARRPR